MYTDMYDTFEEKSIPYCYPFRFTKDKLDYMESNSAPTYTMDVGDSAVFPFIIDDKYKNYQILLTVYNFRFEEVYAEYFLVCPDNKIYFCVNSELSSEIFKHGIYYCRLQAILRNEFCEDTCTLIHPEDCIIYVR